MTEGIRSTEPDTLTLTRVCKATRFALACILFGVAYISIRQSLGISRFQRIYTDMLGENEKLPSLTTFVFWARPAFLALSICVPVACVAFLFARDVARSISFIGALILISILQSVILYQALWSPLGKIVEKMQQ